MLTITIESPPEELANSTVERLVESTRPGFPGCCVGADDEPELEEPLVANLQEEVGAEVVLKTANWPSRPGARSHWRPCVPLPVSSTRMARSADHPLPTYSAQVRRLAAARGVKLPTRRLDDVLAERGPLRGPVSDTGSRAVQEQRGERG